VGTEENKVIVMWRKQPNLKSKQYVYKVYSHLNNSRSYGGVDGTGSFFRKQDAEKYANRLNRAEGEEIFYVKRVVAITKRETERSTVVWGYEDW